MGLTVLNLSIPRINGAKTSVARTGDVPSSLREFWSKQGIKLRPGLSPAALEKFESELSVKFPDDLKSYFLIADGFDGEMDDECLAFYSMEEGIDESKIWTPPGFDSAFLFAFADYLISSHVYMIELRDGLSGSGSVYVVYDNNAESIRKVAGTFSDFVEGYTAHDYSVLFPK
jgi:hypothetical protein